jgi:hypothetical protein
MYNRRQTMPDRASRIAASAVLCCIVAFSVSVAFAQETQTPQPAVQAATQLPNAPSIGGIDGVVTDTSGAAVPNAIVNLEEPESKAVLLTTKSDADGAFTLTPITPGSYRVRIKAQGFSQWKVEDVVVRPAETATLTTIELGVEAIDSAVDAITVEDLAEQQITAEEHQRILGILPNFYVSYLHGAAQPLTNRQKFKLALVISRDPLTFMTTGISAGIEQAQGDLAGYGPGPSGYAQRYAAGYGDKLSATFFGSAIYPSLFHQDPRYFYNGQGSVIHRALYAISTIVICKGDNGKWQPNYSNVLGNLTSGAISSLYYPNSARHDIQTSVDNIFIGIGEGSISTLFQEFILRHLTHGVPKS